MPTSYTAPVQDGTVTAFPAFALLCARASDALIMMRDQRLDAPVPERIEPDTKYQEQMLADAYERRAQLLAISLSVNKTSVLCATDFKKRHEAWEKRLAARAEERARYETMLAKVCSWIPPTGDHVWFKEFMIQQLKNAIALDCSSLHDPEPQPHDRDKWFAEQLKAVDDDIARYTKTITDEITRAKERNEWLSALRASSITATEVEAL